jgi:ABC-2 type transport system permease protein
MFSLWATSLGVMISTIAQKEEQIVTMCIICMFLFSALGGAWFPLEVAGGAFETVGHILPTAWVMDAFQDLILRGFGIEALAQPALILAGYTAVFFAVALWRVRRFTIAL